MKIAPAQAEQEISKTQNGFSAVYALQDADFDDICHLAAEICHSPIALISVIDSGRHWFRSRHPLITADLSADFAFCNQALHTPKEIFIISDLLKDYRFGKNLLVTSVPYVAFYAGIPLVSPEGSVLGTICIWDNKPRELSPAQIAALRSLARQTAANLELRKKAEQLTQQVEEMNIVHADLESFATVAAHDLKSPLNAIISLTDLLKNNYATALDEEGNEYINFLYDSAQNLTDLVTSILNYSMYAQLLTTQKEYINFTGLIDEIIKLFKIPENITIIYGKNDRRIYTNYIALKQILMNLLDNALTFNDKDTVNIEITLVEDAKSYRIAVKDNGLGIPGEERETIFELFKRLPNKINESKGIRIGLAIVKKLVEKLGGGIIVESALSEGTTFTISLPK